MCMTSVADSDNEKRLAPWMNQSSLAAALEGGALGWISATDYYRLPHVLYFDSVASIGGLMRGPVLGDASSTMKKSSHKIRTHSLAFYRRMLIHLMNGAPSEAGDVLRPNGPEVHASGLVDRWHSGHWQQLPRGGTCRKGFITQADFPQAGCVRAW